MIVRITYVFVSTALLAGLAVLLLSGIAGQDRGSLAATRDLVHAGALRVESGLTEAGGTLVPVIGGLVVDDDLAADLKALAVAVNLVAQLGKVPEFQRNRIEGLRTSIRDRAAAWLEAHPEIDAYTLVDESGVVLVSTSKLFKEGATLPVPDVPEAGADDAEPESDEGEGAAPAPDKPAEPAKPADKSAGFMVTALAGELQNEPLLDASDIRWLTAAAIARRGRPVGALLLENKLQALPATPGAEACLFLKGQPLLGRVPEGVEAASSGGSDTPALLVAKHPSALLFGSVSLPLEPFFIGPGKAGLWGMRFSVRGVPDAHGYVVADSSPTYAALGGLQALALGAVLLVWLAHLLLLLLGGRGYRAAVERIADFLGRFVQGQGEERQVNEASVPRDLVRLVRLLNKAISPGTNGGVSPMAKAPSIDEVLEAQRIAEPAAEPADLEFRGISGGSIDVSSTPAAATAVPAEAAPAAPGDGYESLGDVAQAAEAAVVQAEVQTPEEEPAELPQLPEAMAAIEQIAEPAAAPAPESPPASAPAAEPKWETEPAGGVAMGSGPPAQGVGLSKAPPRPPAAKGKKDDLGDLLDEYATDATTVMQLSPELMSAMKQAASAPEAEGAAAGLSEADAELAGLAKSLTAKAPAPRPPPAPPAGPAERAEATVVDAHAPTAAQAAHYREVFNQFVETRKQCGESTSDLTYEKFVGKLEKSRAAVISKHHCADVRFQVYVKDGKAALKALPAK
jgi:hypothetical protein